jgi:hypothetical protein
LIIPSKKFNFAESYNTMEKEWPVLPPDFKVSERILRMRCVHATPKLTEEELQADPRLAHICEEAGITAANPPA